MADLSSSSSINTVTDPYDEMTSSPDHVTAGGGVSTLPAAEYIELHSINPGFRETDEDIFDDQENVLYRNDPDLARRRHSSARLYRQASHKEGALPTELLSMLPSRSLSFRGEGPDEADGVQSDSTKYRTIREAKLRRRQSLHNAIYRRASFESEVTDGVMNDLISSPDQATLDSRSSAIREMCTSLRHKRSMRNKITTLDPKTMKKPSWSKRTQYAMSMTLRHFRMRIAAVIYSLGFWQGHLKTVEGHFGTGVASYFIFLRVLFLLNLPLFVLSFSFIVTPQLLYRFLQKIPRGYGENEEFSGLDLLTGAGWLENTTMYYGYYINGSINVFSGLTNGSFVNLSGLSYNMQYAYVLTCAGYYLLCLLILGQRTAKSYRKNFVDTSGSIQEHFIVKVLNGWNHTVMTKSTATLRQKFMYKEMREYLSTTKKEKRLKSGEEWCRLVFIRIMTNITVLLLIGGSGFMIWFLYTQQSLKTDLRFLREMALPLCISAFNIVMPAAFSMLGSIEKYGTPRVTLYMALIRTMLMKGVTLAVLIYFWLVKLNCHQKDIEGLDLKDVVEEKGCEPCWETYMGQEIYRLVLVDFAAYLITVFFLEFCRRLLSDHCCKFLGKPEFDIGRNTLDLIFSQALCWLGAFYSPMLSFIQLIKLFIIFYIKKVSVMQNCAPSQKPWRAARINTVFLAFLCAAFLMVSVSVAMSIILIKPSVACGPYRYLNSTYDVITDLVDDWRTKYPGLSGCITFFSSEGALSGLIITLICFVYYLRIMAKGRQELIQFLLHQVRLEGRDKNYLLRKYKEIQSERGAGPRHIPTHATTGTVALPHVTVEITGVSPRRTRSAAAPRTPPTPYTEITPSSESVLPLTDYSDGLTPDSFTPTSDTPASARTPASVTPKSVTIAVTPESERSDEITARELSINRVDQSPTSVDDHSAEVPAPDYLSSDEIPAPDYLSSDEVPVPDYADDESEMIELRDFDRNAGIDRANLNSDHTGYDSVWK